MEPGFGFGSEVGTAIRRTIEHLTRWGSVSASFSLGTTTLYVPRTNMDLNTMGEAR